VRALYLLDFFLFFFFFFFSPSVFGLVGDVGLLVLAPELAMEALELLLLALLLGAELLAEEDEEVVEGALAAAAAGFLESSFLSEEEDEDDEAEALVGLALITVSLAERHVSHSFLNSFATSEFLNLMAKVSACPGLSASAQSSERHVHVRSLPGFASSLCFGLMR